MTRTCGLCLLAWLAGLACTWMPPAGGVGPRLADAMAGMDWVALAGTWNGPAEHRVEVVTFADLGRGETHVVRYDIRLAPGSLVMVAQSPLGLPLYDATVSEGVLEIVRHVQQVKALPIERTLADFVLAHWPVSELTAAAATAGYTMLHREGERKLFDPAGRLLVDVHLPPAVSDGVIHVIHHDIPLEVSIRSVASTTSGFEP